MVREILNCIANKPFFRWFKNKYRHNIVCVRMAPATKLEASFVLGSWCDCGCQKKKAKRDAEKGALQ